MATQHTKLSAAGLCTRDYRTVIMCYHISLELIGAYDSIYKSYVRYSLSTFTTLTQKTTIWININLQYLSLVWRIKIPQTQIHIVLHLNLYHAGNYLPGPANMNVTVLLTILDSSCHEALISRTTHYRDSWLYRFHGSRVFKLRTLLKWRMASIHWQHTTHVCQSFGIILFFF